jgi:hypothetical protein
MNKKSAYYGAFFIHYFYQVKQNHLFYFNDGIF